MNPLLKFWLKAGNYHFNAESAIMFGIDNLEHQVSELRQQGIPINQEIRTDLGETEFRYWLQDEWREANR